MWACSVTRGLRGSGVRPELEPGRAVGHGHWQGAVSQMCTAACALAGAAPSAGIACFLISLVGCSLVASSATTVAFVFLVLGESSTWLGEGQMFGRRASSSSVRGAGGPAGRAGSAGGRLGWDSPDQSVGAPAPTSTPTSTL